MEIISFFLFPALSVLVFFVPVRWKNLLSLGLSLGFAAVLSLSAFQVIWSGSVLRVPLNLEGWLPAGDLEMDGLSAFFMLLINLVVLSGQVFALGYLAPYSKSNRVYQWGLHWFAFLLLHFSMVLLCMARDGFLFLLAWELMSIASFLLILFEGHKESCRKASVNYLIQMHVGLIFLISAFAYLGAETGDLGFGSMAQWMGSHRNIGLFLLFFVGFGMKAGLVPLHSWLPEAHPAAPSHVSGVLSGVMIKMGFYGLLRVAGMATTDLLWIGILLFGTGMASGFMGILLGLLQKDIKRLLAYSSVEHAGIIAIGIGTGLIGKSLGFEAVAALGFVGALLHILNHALFKPMLFFSAGLVYQATHTRNMEQLGGLIHALPKTAMVMFFGSAALCALPPLNGFVSEFLIYLGLYNALGNGNLYLLFLFLAGILILALVGGLSLMAFSRLTGMVFLGHPRNEAIRPHPEPRFMHFALFGVQGFLMVLIGLFPAFWTGHLLNIAGLAFGLETLQNPLAGGSWLPMALLAGFFLLLVIVLRFLQRRHDRKIPPATGPVWGCGYTGPAARMQYSGSSFVQDLLHISRPLTRFRRLFKSFPDEEIFPEPRLFASHSSDLMESGLVKTPATLLHKFLGRMAVTQTGQLQHYILYAFLFMLLVFILSTLNWI